MPLLFGGRRGVIFRVFLHHRNHLLHSFLDFADLRMHFLDEIMLDPGQLFDALALLSKLVQKGVLFDYSALADGIS